MKLRATSLSLAGGALALCLATAAQAAPAGTAPGTLDLLPANAAATEQVHWRPYWHRHHHRHHCRWVRKCRWHHHRHCYWVRRCW